MAKLSAEPVQLAGARRCGAYARTTGKTCRAPAVKNRPRCRMHGCAPGSGGPRGAAHGNFKHGRRSIEAMELGREMRDLARTAETLTAVSMNRVGLKPLKPLRRKAHVKRALAELKKAKEQPE
jgi:hypothetical protein